ncbi:glycosyltransferase family 39 protein [Candidatus Saccharibacteria bacterium]|nr:glycosyltransferase family 39 protein [Candidatus Saccharibacteria bacterium]
MKKTNSQLNTFFKTYGGYVILAGIIALVVLFKFYHLSSLPPGLHPDEAANGMDIFRILQNHDLRIVYSTNGPREALFFYIQAGFVAVLGNTILALRVAPAIFGILAVIFVYLYTKDWFGRRTALLAAFLLAVNPWVNTVSRDGFRASMVPFMIAIVAFLGGRAYKSGKARYFALAAFFFGLGFYTYTAFALFSLVVVSGLIYIAIWRRDWIKQNAKNLLIAFAVFIITLMPLVVTVVRHPSESVFRASSTSFLNKDLNHGKPIQTFLEGTTKTLLQYNYQGDENSRHNLPGQPLLNTFVGIMLILGLLVAFSRIGRVKYAAVIAMFFVMFLPAILTAEGLPHALRSIGTVASVFTLSAIGIDYLLTRWYRTFPVNGPARSFGVVTISLLLALTAIIGWRQYFVAWAQDPQTYVAYNESAVALGDYLASHASATNYVIAGGYETLPTAYLTNKKATYVLLDTKGLQDLPLANGSMQFLLLAGDSVKAKIDILQAKFPNGQLTPHFSSFNDKLLFYSFQVNS